MLKVIKSLSAPEPPAYLKSGQLEYITPAIAQTMLLQVHPNLQRKLKPHIVDEYARDMNQGFWLPIPTAIIISNTGKLMDAQHRLHAIVKTGIGQWITVFRDCPEEIFIAIDRGHSRTFGDTLPPTTVYKGAVSSSLTLLYQYENGTVPGASGNPTAGEKDELSTRHPDFANSVNFVMRKLSSKLSSKFLKRRRSILIVCHYLARASYPGQADNFIDKLVSGIGIVDGNSPLLLLRKKIEESDKRQGLTSREINILAAQSINMYIRNEPTSKNFRPNRQPKEFPTILGGLPFGHRAAPTEDQTKSLLGVVGKKRTGTK